MRLFLLIFSSHVSWQLSLLMIASGRVHVLLVSVS